MIATALIKGRFTLTELEPESYTDPEVLALCERITYEIDPDAAFPKFYSGEVVVETTDGRTLRHRESVNRGSHKNPLTPEQVVEKFRGNAELTLNPERAQRALDAILDLDGAGTPSAIGELLTLA
jgi:2-methylcitrate dehydratase PrpD